MAPRFSCRSRNRLEGELTQAATRAPEKNRPPEGGLLITIDIDALGQKS
jgi:hypothetical protein